MRIVQPSELKVYFSLEDELHLQDQLKKQFTGIARPGFYTISWEYPGRNNQLYLVGFLIEVNSQGASYIIEVYISNLDEFTRKEFDIKIEKLSDNAETNSNTIIARATFKQKRQEIINERNRIDRQNRKN